jgi:hypothetical protein
MRKRLTRIIVGPALLSAASQRDFAPLVHPITFPLALALYPLALALVVGVLVSSFALGFGLWLLWHWLRDGTIPTWMLRAIPHPLRDSRHFTRWLYRPRKPAEESEEDPVGATPSTTAPAVGLAGDATGVHLG